MNIASGGRGMQQEENQLPMSGYLGLFETCVTEFVQIWVSLLLFWVCLCFLFLERTWSCLFLWVFLCVCSPEKFWVYWFVGD